MNIKNILLQIIENVLLKMKIIAVIGFWECSAHSSPAVTDAWWLSALSNTCIWSFSDTWNEVGKFFKVFHSCIMKCTAVGELVLSVSTSLTLSSFWSHACQFLFFSSVPDCDDLYLVRICLYFVQYIW